MEINQLKLLEIRVEKIEQRNKNVESDKAWETSLTRKILLIFFTYATISLYLWLIHIPSPLLNAIVPAIGFLLSTLSLPIFKNWWKRYFYQK